ncbi:MAG: CRISPR-associated protein Cas4 [Bacteroidetes bacterium]|jgi:CRISPR-associated exonuclease Cas4|nr:CRISPR-associated protein Cas4 [Bacteroidota bacterium]
MTSATLITYLHLCHRKLWLHHHHIRMEHNSDTVAEGKLIGESTYQRRAKKWKELDLGYTKVDHFDPHNNEIREVKKSRKLEHAHVAQVKYYIYVLEKRGVQNVTGIIEYPKHRKTTKVELTDIGRKEIEGWQAEIERIINLAQCPDMVKKSYCRNCAFYDFCFV